MDARSFLIAQMAQEKPVQVAREIGVRSDQVHNWLKGTHRIQPKMARRLGRYFNVGPENFLDLWYETTEETFGCELRRWRLRMGLSLLDLAVRIGYCEKTLCNWENGYPMTEEKQNEIRMLFESVESNLPENF